MPTDAARAQVAAAWVRGTPQAGQAAVPALPPRETRPQGESKKEKRERERAVRKAAYEQKKAEKEQRKRGGQAAGSPARPTALAPAPTTAATAPPADATAAPSAPQPTSPATPYATAHAGTAPATPYATAHAGTAPTPVIPAAQAAAPAHTPTTDTPAPITAAAAAAAAAAPETGAPVAAPAGGTAGTPSRTGTPPAAAPAAKPGARTRAGGDFDVPRPGGRIPAGGRRTHVALRATLLVTTCVFALGSCGVMGLVIGRSSGPGTAGLDAADAARYRLTEFPTRQAATFAEQYAMLCLTYSPATASKRRADLARYASSGVDAECGWNGEGYQTAVTATWDGTAEKLPEYGDHGRYLGVQVRTKSGDLTTVTVPVYVKDLASGEGMRIAGDVGEMPLPARADAPEVDQNDEVVDDALSQQLQEKVLPGYFEAWGASDSTAMARFTATAATLTATTGLGGRLSDPTINDVVALVPKSVQGTDPYSYRSGQSVQVRVVVDWGDPHGETVRRAYRLTVVNTAQGWFIRDIRGGVLDAQGGRADSADDGQPADGGDGSAADPTGGVTPSASGDASTAGRSSKGKGPAKPRSTSTSTSTSKP
ncbi:conjugal transfer protein [Streptomyces sp. NPDC058251]|uniref:conjugal transfer protein n=1 Tax=Streptomyces sp. NPDC058251 TaxID=3346404 RepID=UPI0036E265DC